ncbi:MAG: DNA-3-methyladenine glycosylase 2 family protein [Myxococcota bacterium]
MGRVHQRIVTTDRPLGLMSSVRLLRFGPADPSYRLHESGFLRGVSTPEGPGLLRVERRDRQSFEVHTYGPGAERLIERAPSMLGVDDGDTPEFREHPVLRKLAKKLSALRLVQTPTVFESFVTMVLQQRVSWRDAAWSYRQILLRHGEPAPGPFPEVYAQPPPSLWRSLPQSRYQDLGVDARRAQTLKRAAVSWRRLEEISSMSPQAADKRLRALPGVGVWTSQFVLGFALGFTDAVPLGDYDLPRLVGFALAGEDRADDPRMVELLAPHRGQRFRVIRMLQESGIPTPRFGPRRGSGPGPGRTSRH